MDIQKQLLTQEDIEKKKKQTNVNYWSALMLLVTTMIGVGYLTLPAILRETGLITGLFLIIITGCAASFGSFMITRAYKIQPTANYPDLVYNILGKKHYYIMIVDVFLYVIFSTTMYFYFSNALFQSILEKYDVKFFLDKNQLGALVALMTFILTFFQLQKLRFTSYIGNIFSFYGAVVLMAQMYSYFKNYEPNVDKDIQYIRFTSGFFTAFGACFFSYTNQFSIITILKILVNEDKYTNYSSVLRSQYLPIFLYTSVGFAGYISFGKFTPDFILERPKQENSNDVFMTIAQSGLIFSMLIGLCVRVKSATDIFSSLFTDKDKEYNTKEKVKLDKWKLYLQNFLWTLLPFLFSLIVDRLINVISLLSSILCPYFIIIAPSLMNLKLYKELQLGKANRIGIIIFMSFFTTMLVICIGVNAFNFSNIGPA